jgi:DNA repair protein RadC
MATPILPETPPPPRGAAVLTHPAFDRSAVHNERRPERKKGAVSLDRARRARIAQASASDTAPAGPPLDETIVRAALILLERRVRSGPVFSDPYAVKSFLCLQLAEEECEVFAVMFLDARLRLISFEKMFRGSLTHTAVHPREVAKRALALNAGAVVLAHNHPSGCAEPSRADMLITEELRKTLRLVEVRVIDHMIIAGASAVSFAEKGFL